MYYLTPPQSTPKKKKKTLVLPLTMPSSTTHSCAQDRHRSTVFNSTSAFKSPQPINHHKLLSSLPLSMKPVLFSPAASSLY